MRSKIGFGVLGITVAFLLATNPVVVNAHGLISSAQIKNNSIKSKDIRNNAIKGIDVRDNSLTGVDVTDNALTGVDVTDNALTGVDVTDNALTGADVNESTLGTVPGADKLDGLDANQIARTTTVSATTTVDNVSSGTFTNIISRSVTAPTSGIFIISGVQNATRDVDGGAVAHIYVRGAVNGAAATAVSRLVDNTTHSSIYGTPIAVSGAFPVAAGTHTVSLQVAMAVGQGYFTDRSLTVTFVPFGNSGAQGSIERPAPEAKPESVRQ